MPRGAWKRKETQRISRENVTVWTLSEARWEMKSFTKNKKKKNPGFSVFLVTWGRDQTCDCVVLNSLGCSLCINLCVNMCQRRWLTAHIRKTQPVCHDSTMGNCGSFHAAEPGHPNSPSCLLCGHFHSSKHKHPAGWRLKVDRKQLGTLGVLFIPALQGFFFLSFGEFHHIFWYQSVGLTIQALLFYWFTVDETTAVQNHSETCHSLP